MDEPTDGSLLLDLQREALLPALFLLSLVGFILLGVDPVLVNTPPLWGLGFIILALVMLVWGLHHLVGHAAAAWALNVGLLTLTLMAWHWFPGSNAQHAFILPVLAAAIMLGRLPSLGFTLVSSALLVLGGAKLGLSPPAMMTDIAILWLMVSLLHVALCAETQSILWAWQGYEEAHRRLEEARERQAELKQALKDSVLARQEVDRLNRLLSAATRAVEEARRDKEEFVANVSHELRTPLNMIIGFSEMISEGPEVYSRRLPPALLADVAAIKRNSQHLASLVDDVLALAEAEAGRTLLLQETILIQELVAEAAEAVAALFKKKGLYLDVVIAPDLPPVYCDRTRLRQVLLNLLSNAGRFTEEGGARVEAGLDGGMCRVTVTDTGPGIDVKASSRLFRPFEQDQTMRRRLGGTGLGLAISKRFVELHGGRIWLESEPGQGTRVSFTVPLTAPPAETVQRWLSPDYQYVARSGPSRAPVQPIRPRVVVVERGQALSQAVTRYLDGVEAVAVENLEEASRMAEASNALAVLINEPPQVSTAEQTSQRLALRFDIPVIFCSLPERRAQAEELGAQAYLTKPIERREMLATIRQVAPKARHILLADDDAEARQLFSRMLASTEERYLVLQAKDGETTLSLLRERHPDLLLLDLIMPNGDGFQVLSAKGQDPSLKDIPVVIISARDARSEPIISQTLVVTRPHGLTVHDQMAAVQALMHALQPRFGAVAPPGKPGGS